MRGIFEYMLPYLRGNYTPQRVVTAAVFAAFVNNCKDDRELLQKLVNSLLSSIVDPNVKLVTLKGLSNVVANGAEQTNRYECILTAPRNLLLEQICAHNHRCLGVFY